MGLAAQPFFFPAPGPSRLCYVPVLRWDSSPLSSALLARMTALLSLTLSSPPLAHFSSLVPLPYDHLFILHLFSRFLALPRRPVLARDGQLPSIGGNDAGDFADMVFFLF